MMVLLLRQTLLLAFLISIAHHKLVSYFYATSELPKHYFLGFVFSCCITHTEMISSSIAQTLGGAITISARKFTTNSRTGPGEKVRADAIQVEGKVVEKARDA